MHIAPCRVAGVAWACARAMRVRVWGGARPVACACLLAALAGLSLLLNSEVLPLLGRSPPSAAQQVAAPASNQRVSWRAAAAAMPFVYRYPARGAPQFSGVNLGIRRVRGCPGGGDETKTDPSGWSPPPPPPPPVTLKTSEGRLGNRVMEYASAWALARVHRLPAFLPDDLLAVLKKYFEGLSLRGASEVLGSDQHCRALGDADPWTQLEHVDLTDGTTHLADAVATARHRRAIIVLDSMANLPEVVVPEASLLREEMRFRLPLVQFAQSRLHRLTQKHFPKFDGEVVFAAVHARRTDYPRQLELLYNVSEPAGADYYVAAAAWLRRKVPDKQRLLLVVCSDDPQWAQSELVAALSAAGAAERHGEGWTAVWGCSGDGQRPQWDLALMAACNHTLFAYGTFGLAAALLAGGRAAVFQLAPEPLNPRLLSVSEQYARRLPGWAALR